MRKTVLLWGVVACLAACRTAPEPTATYTYTAHAYTTDEEGQSASAPHRTALDPDNTVVWCAGDEFMLYDKAGEPQALFHLSDGIGTGEGTFSSTTTQALSIEATYRAYYPANLPVSNGEYVWPMVQEHSPNQCANAPMVSRWVHVNEDQTLTDLHFINLGGLLKVSLSGNEPVSSIVFHGIRTDIEEETEEQEIDAQEVIITLTNCDKAAGPYYIVVQPGEYSAVRLAFINSEHKVAVKTLKAENILTVERNKILPMSLPALGEFKTIEDAVPITWKGQTVFFATKNYGADDPTQLGTEVDGENLPTVEHWRVPTAQEMEILFHWTKTIDDADEWNGSTPNPDYSWSWQEPCAIVKDKTGALLYLPTAKGQNIPFTANYWSSTGVTTSWGEYYRYMYNVSYDSNSIVTAVGTGMLTDKAYLRLVYDF